MFCDGRVIRTRPVGQMEEKVLYSALLGAATYEPTTFWGQGDTNLGLICGR